MVVKCDKICEGLTKQGLRCKRSVSCHKGKRTRCSSHGKSRRYDYVEPPPAAPDTEDEEEEDEEHLAVGPYDHTRDDDTQSSWPLAEYEWPGLGNFPEPPEPEFKRQNSWRDDTDRIYRNVSCPTIRKSYGKHACRHFFKCNPDCQTKDRFKGKRSQIFDKYERNPLGYSPSSRR